MAPLAKKQKITPTIEKSNFSVYLCYPCFAGYSGSYDGGMVIVSISGDSVLDADAYIWWAGDGCVFLCGFDQQKKW